MYMYTYYMLRVCVYVCMYVCMYIYIYIYPLLCSHLQRSSPETLVGLPSSFTARASSKPVHPQTHVFFLTGSASLASSEIPILGH